jgi:hypothetical protein
VKARNAGKEVAAVKEIAFPQFVVQAPQEWFDVTSELEAEDSPATVAAEEGLGALQFSVAELPEKASEPTTVETLRALLKEFARGHDLGQPHNVTSQSAPRIMLSASFRWGDDHLQVWYLAELGKLVFATYTCEAGEAFAEELATADAIVRSLRLVTS